MKRAAIVTLTLAATVFTASPSRADEPPTTPPQATPLVLRPSNSGPHDATSPSRTTGWKIGFVALIAVGGLLLWKQKQKKQATRAPLLSILGRTPVGVRSEILIVHVDGQRLLLGVTPHSIQRLSVLGAEDGALAEATDEEPFSFGGSAQTPVTPTHARNALAGLRAAVVGASRGDRAQRVAERSDDDLPEEQVRGLLRAGRPR